MSSSGLWRTIKSPRPCPTVAGEPTTAQAIAVALYLTELIDTAVRSELGRYKTSRDYGRFRHKERHMANASFALGMVASIAEKLTAMKAKRDEANSGNGRDLVVLKTAIVDAELEKLDLKLRRPRGASRMVSMTAYEAGSTAGASLAINPGIGEAPTRQTVRKGVDFHLPRHPTANGRISTDSVPAAGCRPSGITSTMSGASRVRRRTRP
jgi:hypothetical protein